MTRRRRLALLFAAFTTGCSTLTPFVTAPPPLDQGEKNPGQRVAICYNTFKTPPEKVQELAQAECGANTIAEKIGTDYRLDDCPALTPGRATFLCKPK
jgi:hypothetical protein